MRVRKIVEVVWSVDREPLLFVRGDVRVESNRSREICRLVAPCFLLTRWHVGCACVRVSAPCIDQVVPVIGSNTTERWYAQKRLSFCTVSGVMF
jgi:hypothetical protein